MAEILILPLFPAQPKLGPVFFPVTHLVPAKFPILILVPALALDLLWQRTRAWKPWKVAVVSGFVFIAVLAVVEWPFASFLLSKASENRFFGTIYFDYNSRPNGIDRMRLFFHPDHGAALFEGSLARCRVWFDRDMGGAALWPLDEERAAMRFWSFRVRWALLVFLLGALAAPQAAQAHVGSKDVFEQVKAGPYKLFVTIRTPTVIPGVAKIEVRSSGAAVDGIHITPVPMTGEAANHPPAADVMTRSASDPAFFTGNLWMMASGSWEVRFEVSGASGRYTTAVPVPAAALSTMTMHRSLGITLGMLGLFLMIGMAGMVAAAVRDARLAPGATAAPALRRRALVASAVSLGGDGVAGLGRGEVVAGRCGGLFGGDLSSAGDGPGARRQSASAQGDCR